MTRILAVVLCGGLVSCLCPQPVRAPPSAAEMPAGAGARSRGQPAGDPALVELSIEGAPPRPRSGSRLNIRVRLRNVSDKWLWLQYGFGVAPPEAAGSLWLDVAELATGRTLQWHCSEGTAEPDDQAQYILLAPATSTL
jgi:hypothetical protein